MRTDAASARALAARDPLARFRDAFVVSDPGLIYEKYPADRPSVT